MQPKAAPSFKLPASIATFFAHETTDPQAVARCFSEDAVVVDEGHEHHGRADIATWNAQAVAKYQFATEPLMAQTVGAKTTVTARVTGSFPGSPIQLRFRFTVAGDLISRLEITP
jgi:ketosteroid isomerase-like protein